MQQRYTPKNITQGKRILGFRKRNLAEGIIAALIMAIIIGQIPFVPKVRWIITICLAIFLILINGLGIKGRSYSQTVRNFINYKRFIKPLSYRRINNAPDETEQLFEEVNGKTRIKTIHEQTALGKAQRLIKR